MVNIRLAGVGISAVLMSGVVVLSQKPSAEAGPGGPESQKAGRAARAFAQSVTPEGSPAHTAALRRALALAEGLPVSEDAARSRTLPAMTRGLIDLDVRYRRNFTGMHPQERIWGGERVPSGTYADTVAIIGNGGLCTGTVISSTAVLTAAHCVCRGVMEQVVVGDTISRPASTVRVAQTASMIKCTDALSLGDIAVLTLAAPVNVAPRAFAHESLIAAATVARAVGYGRTENPIAEPAGIKRRVDVPIASIACDGTVLTPDGAIMDSAFYGCAPNQEIVAGAPSLDKDSCNGDSGGPLFVISQDGNVYLAGATSRATGPPGLRPCGDGGIYVRTDSRVLKWLQSVGVAAAVGPPR